MALVSMTGFARGDGQHDGLRWTWEIKTVNGKSQDVRLRLPYGFEAMEPEVRAVVPEYVRRGSCQLSLNVSRVDVAGELRINDRALELALAAVKRVASEIDTAPPSAEGILALKGVLEVSDAGADDDEEALAARNGAMMDSLRATLADLRTMRQGEGARLEAVLAAQIGDIEKLAEAARDCPARSVEAISARLHEHIERLMSQSGTFDEDRLHQEAVLLAAKADIQEELDRLFAHVEAAREHFSSAQPVGRKLDFLTQEFNREANTLCSKSNAAELTRIGLDLKAVIDQMREQVQNIE